jgi:hypothetical protein
LGFLKIIFKKLFCFIFHLLKIFAFFTVYPPPPPPPHAHTKKRRKFSDCSFCSRSYASSSYRLACLTEQISLLLICIAFRKERCLLKEAQVKGCNQIIRTFN